MSIFSRKAPRFIALGDMVIDAFIRLNQESRARVQATDTGDSRELVLPFGDKIPFEFAEEIVAVGNSANAAVSASRLGIRSALISNIGSDENGKKCLARLGQEGVATSFIKTHTDKNTNYHYVLWYEDERTILIKHELFDYKLPNIKNLDVLYLSSVSENALPLHEEIADFLENNPATELVFQPGTYQIKWGTEKLKRIYAQTSIFFCNIEEAVRILNISTEQIYRDTPDGLYSKSSIQTLLDGIKNLGPKLPVITDGPHGVYTYDSDANGKIDYSQIIHLAIYPDIAKPYERTGAGDAFASTFSIARLKGKSVTESLKWASINSMHVCQYTGAQKGLLSEERILHFLNTAPHQWEPTLVC